MAIKVGGTTVIDDSRALTNIASVDATTVAALGTAGVGGGGGVVSMQASGGNITAGDIVSLNSDGTVTSVSVAGGVDTIKGVANPNAPVDVTTPYVTHILDTYYDSANSRIICLIFNPSGYASVMVGTISSGLVTAWTTPVFLSTSFTTDTTTNNANIVYNSTGGYFLACFAKSNSYIWHAAFSVNSSNVVTAHNEGEVGNWYWPGLRTCKASWDSTLNRFISGGLSTNNNSVKFRAFTWNTNSSNFFTNLGGDTETPGTNQYAGVEPGEPGLLMSAYTYNGTNDLRLKAFWLTNNSPTLTTSSQSSNINTVGDSLQTHPKIAYNEDDDEYVVVYSIYDNSKYYIFISVFSFDKTTGFTTHSGVKTLNDYFNGDNAWDVIWSPDIQKYSLIVGTGFDGLDFPDNQMSVFNFTANATTGAISTPVFAYKAQDNSNETRIFYNDALGTFGHTYNQTELFQGKLTRVPKWLGIAKDNITSGSSGDVHLLSGISPDQSGLSSGETYYIDPETNTLTTTDTGYKVGKALSATKLLITEGNA